MNTPTTNLKELTKACCPQWPILSEAFHWMVFTENDRRKVMPHLKIRDDLWRVKHCPSCGTDVTNVVNLNV